MKLLKSTILLQVAQCGWRDRWDAVQKSHTEKNQIKLDHGCIGALEALKKENPTEDGNWVCDDIFTPKPEYTCKNVCLADGEVSGEISVKCRLTGPESKIRGYVDCPPAISEEQSRGMKQSRRDKCDENIIDITNGELKFFRARGVTKKEYNVWCGGAKSKIRVKCDEVRPNSHPKKWVFTKGKNPDTACPGSGSTGGGSSGGSTGGGSSGGSSGGAGGDRINHCLDEAFLNAKKSVGEGRWVCDGTDRSSVCRAVCNDENATADVWIRCFRNNLAYIRGDSTVQCEGASDVLTFSPLNPMPLLRNCNGVRDSNNASKMPWVTELTIDSSRKCRATAVNDQWLITAATCCANTESITMPSGASASAIHMNGFYGDLSDGTGRNFDFCLVKFQNHGLSIPCRSSTARAGTTCWTYAEDGSSLPLNHLGGAYCEEKSAVTLAPSELCYGYPDMNDNGMTDAIGRDLLPGTPVFCNDGGKAALVGVGSLVETCMLENFPAIYGDISDALVSDWIQSKL